MGANHHIVNIGLIFLSAFFGSILGNILNLYRSIPPRDRLSDLSRRPAFYARAIVSSIISTLLAISINIDSVILTFIIGFSIVFVIGPREPNFERMRTKELRRTLSRAEAAVEAELGKTRQQW